jgi:hypothetical protein
MLTARSGKIIFREKWTPLATSSRLSDPQLKKSSLEPVQQD